MYKRGNDNNEMTIVDNKVSPFTCLCLFSLFFISRCFFYYFGSKLFFFKAISTPSRFNFKVLVHHNFSSTAAPFLKISDEVKNLP